MFSQLQKHDDFKRTGSARADLHPPLQKGGMRGIFFREQFDEQGANGSFLGLSVFPLS
jgi:hypothetical protein